ncbi:hypothetical protein LCGC14_2578940 [marine sediment metagenome]|uniref:Holin of 3TMs, for gene-transfer release n=1 Tax=marine sediment metagenome TaxID=412755 RepID=A0A0F9B2U4_9ZZZZ
MSIFSKALDIVGDVTGLSSVKDAAKTLIGALSSNPEAEAKMKAFELEQMKIELQDNASLRDLYKAEVQSDDKFVKRARPAMLWLCFGILAVNFGLIPIINAITLSFGGSEITVNYPDLPDNVYFTITSIFGLYAGARSWDKYKKNGKK